MKSMAVVLERPEHLVLSPLDIGDPADDDVVVDVEWSGISTGTERLLWTGNMPQFPGMGYPLVPGYETVGRVRCAGPKSEFEVGQRVFVPGANCFGAVRGLFGGAASCLVVPGKRIFKIEDDLGEGAILLALAATAYHAVTGGGTRDPIVPPDLIIGHGVLGRLLARMTVIGDYPPPTVWETNPQRTSGAMGYRVIRPEDDPRRDYKAIYDVSGDSTIIDAAVQRLASGGEIVLAGFYSQPLSFMFAPAFMREAQIRCAAEWKRADMLAAREIAESGLLPLDDLITHHEVATHAADAYRTAFNDAGCLKMVLDWRSLQ